jgi:hypothetical protein
MTLIDVDDLKLRRRSQEDQTRVPGTNISIGRSGAEDYWTYRVDLTENQALIGFPKHGTIGIDFLHNRGEDLPYTSDPEYLADFFAPGRLEGGDTEISRAAVIRAIKMIREAVVEDGVGTQRCMTCLTIQGQLHRRERPAIMGDPTAGLTPHWTEECTLEDPYGRFLRHTGERDADGWPIKNYDEDDE